MHLSGLALAMAGWRCLAAMGVVVAGVIFCYPLLLGIPLLDPDEGLHASIAQEMVERGDWVTPRLIGKPFLDKPIFYFWAEALSLRVFGMDEAAVRLPGLMFGLLGVATTALMAGRMFGRTTGLIAGMFYATTILPVALTQAAAHDVALIPWVNLALLLLWEAGEKTGTGSGRLRQDASNSQSVPVPVPVFSPSWRTDFAYVFGIGLCLGLTCLTKGLAGLALVGVAYGSYVLTTRRLSLAVCIRVAAALLLATAVASTWYLAAESRNPGYLYYYFVERHVLGYATDTQNHGEAPWWYYLPILLGGGLPWIGYLPATARDGWVKRRTTRAPVLSQGPRATSSNGATTLLWCWLIGGTLFLSLAHSKLVTYIWPLFPSLAILAALAWARLIEGTLSAEARRWFAATIWFSSLAGPVVLPAAMLAVQNEYTIRFAWPVWLLAVPLAAASVLPLGFWIAGQIRGVLCTALFSLVAQFAMIITLIVPQVGPVTSARELAAHFNRLGHLPRRLLLAEDRIGSLVFYLDPRLRAGLQDGQLQEVHFHVMPPPEPGAIVALPERKVHHASRYCNLDDVPYLTVGHYRLYDAAALQR